MIRTKLLGELTSQRQGPWLTPVMWAGVVGFVAMVLLALESLLGFGPEVRAVLLSVVGVSILGSGFNARQWDMTSEGERADIAPEPPPEPIESGKGGP